MSASQFSFWIHTPSVFFGSSSPQSFERSPPLCFFLELSTLGFFGVLHHIVLEGCFTFCFWWVLVSYSICGFLRLFPSLCFLGALCSGSFSVQFIFWFLGALHPGAISEPSVTWDFGAFHHKDFLGVLQHLAVFYDATMPGIFLMHHPLVFWEPFTYCLLWGAIHHLDLLEHCIPLFLLQFISLHLSKGASL